ncbi:MAG: mycothiol system anti-sigma-R factor [Microlunatus sp.]|nr:mycothiol system anti-sigma-R factor [Microlunatus sp.]MDN5770209.1 mycothiol system anti-sigma-R factor [Microlunatus sp.]
MSNDECWQTLQRVYEFLDNELDEASDDAIRAHLAACEECLDSFDAELAVKTLVSRHCGGDVAPQHLRARVMMQITVARRQLG